LAGARARTEDVEGDFTVWSAHIAVIQAVGVNVKRGNSPHGGHAGDISEERALRVKRGEGAVGSEYKAVKHAVRVSVRPCDCALRVAAIGECEEGTLAGAGACARSVEGGEGALRRTQKAVKDAAGVSVRALRRFSLPRVSLRHRLVHLQAGRFLHPWLSTLIQEHQWWRPLHGPGA
jgi:hypothetical protein